jgi:extradiol dioxygenase
MQIVGLGYLGIEATDPAAWADFGPNVLGLPAGPPGADGTVYLRMDERCYRIAVHPGPRDGLAYLGWEVPSAAALEEAYGDLAEAGLSPRRGTAEECAARQVRGLVHCADPAGNALELFYGQLALFTPFRPARPIGGFVTGDLGLGHVVLGVADLDAAASFYTETLGFRVTDLYARRMVFLHCNPRHHSVAVADFGMVGLRHIMLQVESLDDVGATYDLCLARGVPLTKSIGRHTNDLTVSFYARTPSGFEVEYGWGGRLVDDATWRVTQLEQTSLWGHQRLEAGPLDSQAAAVEAMVRGR